MNQTLIIMVKEPRPGRVKTRLGADIGLVTSAWWFRHQVRRLLRRLRDPRWEIVLAVSPDAEGLKSRVWPGEYLRIPQGSGDLGSRMHRAMSQFRGRVCLIGADIPDVRRAHIARGFAALGAHDLVMGPAEDGGFWLIGAKRPPNRVFDNVRWSTPQARSDTLANANGKSVAFIDTLQDVDTLDDLRLTSAYARDSWRL